MADESDKIDRFEEAFERGEKGQVSDYRAWLENHQLHPKRVLEEDWLREHLKNNPEEAANHDEQLESVAEYLGFFSRRGGQRHLPVVGVSGIGKTVFLHMIQHAIDHLDLDIPVRMLDADSFDEVKDDRVRLRVVQDDLRRQDSSVVLIDNCGMDREIVESLRSIGEAAEEVLVVSSWTPELWRHYCEDVEAALPVTDEIHLEPLIDPEVTEAVRMIFDLLSEGETMPSSGFESAVQRHGFGNPGVILKLVLRSLREAFHSRSDIGEGCVEDAAETLRLTNIEDSVYNLPDSRINILSHMLRDTDPRGTRPSKLVDLTGRDKSTVSYHLRELRQADLVTSTKSGRKAYYSIREVAKPIVQTRIIQQGEIHG